MVRCDVCGKEVLAGWICGIVPAYDSDKMGLCPEHDKPENRARVQEKWEALLQDKLGRSLATERQESRPKAFVVTIHWLGGGIQRLPCRAWDVNQEGDLLLLKKDMELDFYPLQHIKRFSVEDSPAGDEDSDSSRGEGQNVLPPGGK